MLEFQVRINASVLYDYMLHHTYNSMSGILGTIAGGLLIAGFIKTHIFLYIAGGIILLCYLPGSLWLRAKKQAHDNPAFREPLNYRMTEEGIEVSQDDVVQKQNWKDMYRAVSTKSSIIVYTSRVNACIFPRKDLKEMTPSVIEMISTHMAPNRVKIRF